MIRRLTVLSALLALCAGIRAEQADPLAAATDAAAWDRARDQARLNKEFVSNTIKAADDRGVACTDWSFRLREGGFADIFCRRPIDGPFRLLRLRVRNAGAKLTLAVKLGDSSGAEWLGPRTPLAANGEWQDVDLPLKSFAVASWSRDPDGKLTFPLPYLAVIAFDVRPGSDYRLLLGGASLVRSDPGQLTVASEPLPQRVRAGQTVGLRAALQVTRVPADDAQPWQDPTFELVRGGKVVHSAPVALAPPGPWQAGQRFEATARLPLSAWAPGGAATWRLRVPGYDVRAGAGVAGGALGEVIVTARQPGNLRVGVRPWHGAPTLFINDRPTPAMAYAAYGPSPEVFRSFGEAGVRLFSIMGTPTSHGYGLAVDVWLGPDQFDYSQLDERFRMVLEACPDAYVFPRLYVSAPGWWLEQHPEATVLYDPGDGHPVPFVQAGRKVPSWSSPNWRQAVSTSLERLIRYVEQQPYADRVLGYHIASGTTEEWMMWGANDNAWTDYSPDNTAAFRRWLTARYRTDDALRAAWAQPGVTLSTAVVPPRQSRQTSAAGVLRDPRTDAPSVDYIRFIADNTAQTIDLFCGVAKRATRGERLVGVFYGYLLQLFGQRQQNAAHLGFDAVVRSPNVDFVCSPTSYAFRLLGTGTSHFMAPLGSVLANGKLWFDENDIRTSLSPGKEGEWGRPANVAGDLLQQDRELANVLVHGAGQWWFDVGSNRYDHPDLMRHLAHLGQVAAKSLEADRSPADQVALVVDGRGLACINVGDPLLERFMLGQLPPLARIGAPVGHYELHDVDKLSRHRLILFANLHDPSAAQRAAIDQLKGDGRVLVFTHAPAPYRDGAWAPDQMAAVCGLQLRLEDREQAPYARFADDPLVAGIGEGYGDQRKSRPTIVGADPAATVLARLPDGQPGLLLRHYADWTAVWSAAPVLPTGLLVRLCELAKVHRYVTGPDVVWASRELLAVSVEQAGRRTVRLPRPARVTDLYGGKLVAGKATEFEVELPAAGTGLWRVQNVP